MDLCICTICLVLHMCILFMAGSEIRLYTENIAHSNGSYIEESRREQYQVYYIGSCGGHWRAL
jgi:hypothetical protein